MATTIDDARPRLAGGPLAADRYEQALSAGAVILLATVLVALVRGSAHWHEVGIAVWGHLLTILVALALTPVMLLRPRGDAVHRRIGWVWSGGMVLTALLSFFVRLSNHGGLSLIHLLSAYVLVQVPRIVQSARAHDVRRHRRQVRAIVTGALLVAGFFTLPFGRMLGSWLLG